MKSSIRVALGTSPEQSAALVALQTEFARACNALAPQVAAQRCWNRVTLHHLAYKDLREAFPRLGSQMVCNAIYAVCRAARIVYQHPKSPFNVAKRGAGPLPRLQFTPKGPVYFDRHTLSLKNGEVSLFTLAGRIRCAVRIDLETERRLRTEKLREVLLTAHADRFVLLFKLADPAAESAATAADAERTGRVDFPDHVRVLNAADSGPGAV